jgi:hypothetical protein
MNPRENWFVGQVAGLDGLGAADRAYAVPPGSVGRAFVILTLEDRPRNRWPLWPQGRFILGMVKITFRDSLGRGTPDTHSPRGGGLGAPTLCRKPGRSSLLLEDAGLQAPIFHVAAGFAHRRCARFQSTPRGEVRFASLSAAHPAPSDAGIYRNRPVHALPAPVIARAGWRQAPVRAGTRPRPPV